MIATADASTRQKPSQVEGRETMWAVVKESLRGAAIITVENERRIQDTTRDKGALLEILGPKRHVPTIPQKRHPFLPLCGLILIVAGIKIKYENL